MNTTFTRHPMIKLAARLAVAATLAAAAPIARGQTADTNVGITPPTQPAPVDGLIETGLAADGKLALAMNKTAVLTTRGNTARVNISQPDIAEVVLVNPTTVLVTAKKPGQTQVILWNDREQSQSVDVSVMLDIAALRDEIKKHYPDAPITVDVINGQISLRGRVPTLKVAEQVARLAGAYSNSVMNFLEVGGGQQVAVNVQFIEISRAASNQLGFSSSIGDNSNFALGSINGPNGAPINALRSGQDFTIGNGITLFGRGGIGSTTFEVFVQALKTNSLARTLAEPTLVSLSGEDASFLAGGEIPIPVPQAGVGGASTITIEYKKFGVQLKYNAVVLGNGRIRMKLSPEVSQLDYNNTTTINNNPVPGIRTRQLENTVEMAEGETLALAGLLQRDLSSRSSGTPLLSDLPVIGAFFRNVQYTRTETELLVLVTPRLTSSMKPDQVPAVPGDNFRYPNEAELYGLGDIGADKDPTRPLASQHKPAPRFVGPYGFAEPQVIQPTTAPADSK